MWMYISENEKIENALKSFFLEKEKGEAFSLVHLVKFFVQNVADSHIRYVSLSSCLCFLSDCLCFLYKVFFSTIAYVNCTLADMINTFAYLSCTVASLNCMDGA
jgi:hypothetical protein